MALSDLYQRRDSCELRIGELRLALESAQRRLDELDEAIGCVDTMRSEQEEESK